MNTKERLMHNIIVLDCDLISTFAKINKISLLENLFPNHQMVITTCVYDELVRVKVYGFSFPSRILQSNIKLINIQEEERITFEDFLYDYRIHIGEAEGIAIAKHRNGIFLTNDSKAIEFCKEKDVKVLSLKEILRKIAAGKLVSKNEMTGLIRDIEDKDNTFIIGIDDILEEYNDE